MCTSVCRAGFANYDSPKIGTTTSRARATTTSAVLPLDNQLFEDTPLAFTDTALDPAVPRKICSNAVMKDFIGTPLLSSCKEIS